jgi:hypothetical protein
MTREKSAAALLFLLVIASPAYGSHGLQGLSVLAYLVAGIAGLAVLVLLNLGLSLRNRAKKNAVMRVVNILLTLPVLVSGILLAANGRSFGYVMLFLVLIEGWIIYGSFATADEKDI